MSMLTEALACAPTQSGDLTLADSWLLGFDTETTGIRAGSDAIVSATLVLRCPTAGHDADVHDSWLINPHRRMSAGASRVNGFTDEYLSEHGVEPVDALEQMAAAIAVAQSKRIPLLAYNAPFDVHMLSGDLERWHLAPIGDRVADNAVAEDEAPAGEADGSPRPLLVVDPLVIDRKVSHRSGRRTLELTAEYYGVEPSGDYHDALADTVAAMDLIEPMTTLYPQVGHIPLDDLMTWQRQAHDAWLDSYNRWLGTRGRRPVHDGWL